MNWPQLNTILWLRWRLTRNQWAKSGGVGAVIAAIVAVLGALLSIAGFGGGWAVGALGMGQVSSLAVAMAWLGLTAALCFFWMIGLLQELQRSESIDLQRLMHLPVALGQIFVVNYVASHAAISLALIVPAMMGLAIGMAISRGASMLLLIPLALSMVFMITAWTYYLRGWLATLMSNPRRRRAVIMGVTLAFVLMAQLPNLIITMTRPDRAARGKVETPQEQEARKAADQKKVDLAIQVAHYVPPLWVPIGARGLAEGRVLPALLGTLGCFVIGAIGLRRAYLSTLRFYQGGSGGLAGTRDARSQAPGPVVPLGAVGTLFMERRLPGVPEQSAAVALATLRSMLRAPEIKMQFGTSFVVTLLLGGPLLFRRGAGGVPDEFKPFLVTGVMVFAIFLMMQFMANQFGFDREGFRALVLSPAERRLILIGKSLAVLPAPALSAFTLMTIVAVWLRMPALVYVAALFQLVAGLLIAMLMANLLSIYVPYRIQPGTMKPTKMPGLAVLMLVISQLTLPMAMSPLLLPPLAGILWHRFGGVPASAVNVAGSMLLAGILVIVYRWAIGPLGRALWRRETTILNTVSAEVE